jgi:plastocyanin
MRGAGLGLLAAALAAASAQAGDLGVVLKTAKGQPVKDAVVTVYPASGAASGAIRFDWPYRMAQDHLQFDPFVLIVPQGATVSFPNRDNVRHQVYSFSPAHPFELKLYGRDETRTVRFDKTGVIALGCNIHDSMVAFIKVVDTPYAARSGAAGEASVQNLPAGTATVRIWHPYLKAPGNEIVRQVAIPREGAAHESAVLELRMPPMAHMAY